MSSLVYHGADVKKLRLYIRKRRLVASQNTSGGEGKYSELDEEGKLLFVLKMMNLLGKVSSNPFRAL